jgi:hypothetical protein
VRITLTQDPEVQLVLMLHVSPEMTTHRLLTSRPLASTTVELFEVQNDGKVLTSSSECSKHLSWSFAAALQYLHQLGADVVDVITVKDFNFVTAILGSSGAMAKNRKINLKGLCR